MQLKLKTDELKNAVNKVVKGMGNNKLLPITEMLGINVEQNVLKLVSTDGSTKVQVYLGVEGNNETFSFVVNGKSFSQLVAKTTSEFVTLIIEKEKMTLRGNGTYSFSFPSDEDGNLIKLSPILIDVHTDQKEVLVSTAELQRSYNVNKFSIAETNEIMAYTGFYYDKDGSITTNSLKISYINNSLFETPVLLNGKFASLFSILSGDETSVFQNNSELMLVSGNVSILGYKMTEVVDFPIDDIKPFLANDLPHKVRLNKKALLNLLERIAVFVTPFDKGSIKVDFTKEGLRVWTLDDVNNELIPYTDSENLEESSIKVDVTNFKDLVSSNPEDELVIMYGNPSAIKMTFGNVSQVLALVN